MILYETESRMVNMTGFSQMEFRLLDWITQSFQSSVLDILAPIISFLGDGGWIWILLAVVLLIWKKTRKLGLAMSLALVLSLITANIILKPLIARVRPFDINTTVDLLIPAPGDYSFPSGHTQASFAAATVIYRNHKRAGSAALILAAMIGLSRIYLYVHYVSDVLAGAVFGYCLGRIADGLVRSIRYRYNAKKRKKRMKGRTYTRDRLD